MAAIVKADRATEQANSHRYEQWAANEKKAKYLEIALILATVLYVAFEKYFPNFFILFGFGLVTFVLLIGPILFIVSKMMKHWYGKLYAQYIEGIASAINRLGDGFTRTSLGYYDAIDNLYLESLDPTHREMILLRRQQELHNQDMLRLERERQKAEEQHLKEQQRTRQATEELLAIEKERERRYRGW